MVPPCLNLGEIFFCCWYIYSCFQVCKPPRSNQHLFPCHSDFTNQSTCFWRETGWWTADWGGREGEEDLCGWGWCWIHGSTDGHLSQVAAPLFFKHLIRCLHITGIVSHSSALKVWLKKRSQQQVHCPSSVGLLSQIFRLHDAQRFNKIPMKWHLYQYSRCLCHDDPGVAGSSGNDQLWSLVVRHMADCWSS